MAARLAACIGIDRSVSGMHLWPVSRSLATVTEAATRSKALRRTTFPPRKQFLYEENGSLLDQRLAVVLQHNNLTCGEWVAVRKALAPHGVKVRVVRNVLMRAQITNSRYEALQPLFAGPTALAYSNEEDSAKGIKGLLDTLQKTPKLLVIGAKLENALLTHDDLRRVTTLPSLPHLQAQMVATVQTPMTMLVSLLQRSPQLLVANLQLVSSRQDDDGKPS